ncbi:MAG: DUF3592 domain-containing protein [Myxococcaceae bacterium]
MQLAIPSAPRPVRLTQVPGALVRVGLVGGIALVLTIICVVAATWFQAPLAAQRQFLEVATPVEGKVSEVALPPLDRRLETPAKLRVVYQLGGRDYSASGVETDGVEAEKLFAGAPVKLLVDPAAPTRAQEAVFARDRAGWVWLQTAIIGLGLLLTAGGVAFELRRAIRREVAPLRVGALVWLTPDSLLPDTKDEFRFPAHYFRNDVKQTVTASVRPGRRPVRNGDKVLAAVVPTEPTWARVVDEDLARVLGWYAS